jgi:hypothetical protein
MQFHPAILKAPEKCKNPFISIFPSTGAKRSVGLSPSLHHKKKGVVD